MKIYIFKIMSCILVGLLCTTSCTDDFLSEINPNELSASLFFNNNVDLNSGLTAVYNGFKNTNIINIVPENSRADISYPGFGRPNPNNQFSPFYNQTFNDSQIQIQNKWSALYTVIFRANQVIQNGNRLIASYSNEEQIEEANLMVAQARFLRGISYSYLYNMFNQGSVVIFDFIPEIEADFFQPLSSAEDVRAFYLEDLEFAYNNLPPIWTNDGDLGRVTAAAAAAELGRSYLYEADYEQAAEFFGDIATNGAYQRALAPNVGDNFSEAAEFNSESILELNYSVNFKSDLNGGDTQNVSNNLARIFAPGSNAGFRVSLPASWLQIAYKNDPMDLSDPRNFVPCDVTDADCDPTTGTKPRKYALRTSYSIALVDEPDLTYYENLLPAVVGSFNNRETAYYRKYTNWETVASENEFVPNNRSGINVRLVRLADIYLMLAECLIKGGTDDSGVEQAMVLINEVRHRSALQLIGLNGTGVYPGADHNNIAYDADSLMDHLMFIERPLELAVEGHAIRFLDLRRWGILKERFEDLSTRAYYAENFAFINRNGEPANKFGAILLEGEDPNDRFTFKDYERAATNYSESIHAYYPIPNLEVSANPNL